MFTGKVQNYIENQMYDAKKVSKHLPPVIVDCPPSLKFFVQLYQLVFNLSLDHLKLY